MKSPDVSVLGCPWRKDIVIGLPFYISVDSYAPSAEVLGEMTGVFPSKMEHTLYSMLRILYKIIHIKKYKSYGLPEVRSKLQEEIDMLRMFIRHKYCFWTAKEIDGNHILLQMAKVNSYVKAINDILEKECLVNKGCLRIMDTFVLLCQLLCSVIARDFPIPSSFVSGIYFEYTDTEARNKWSKILEALDSDDWTYKKLLLILLPDDVSDHKCFGCGKMVEAEYFRYFEVWCDDSMPGFVEGPIYFVSQVFPIGLFICDVYAECECLGKLMEFHRVNTMGYKSNVAASSIYHDLSLMYQCDNCFKFTAKVHRCSKCLTKLYCGEDCRDEDWSIHQKVCVKDKRKRKDKESVRLQRTIEKDEEIFGK